MRTLALWFGIFVFSLSLSGCDSIYRLLQKEGAEEKELLGDVVPFRSNPRVMEAQKLLKIWGYNIGKPDGKFGANTRTAIKKFQIDHELKVSRFLDKATWAELSKFERYGLLDHGDLNIRAVQTALKAANCDPGPIDGKGGRRTDEAIKKFQAEKGIKPDGRIGAKTLIKLAAYLAPPEPVKQPALKSPSKVSAKTSAKPSGKSTSQPSKKPSVAQDTKSKKKSKVK